MSAQDIEHTVAEKEITAHANHPYMIHLHYSFQTADKLYLGTYVAVYICVRVILCACLCVCVCPCLCECVVS